MKPTRFLSILATVIAVCGLPASAQPRDTLLKTRTCAVADVPGILVLPDGPVPGATLVRICFEGWLNPTTAVHKLFAGDKHEGWPHGMVYGRVGTDESADSDRPVFVFAKDSAGYARLVGYAWPGRGSMLTMAFGRLGSEVDADNLLVQAAGEETKLFVMARVF